MKAENYLTSRSQRIQQVLENYLDFSSSPLQLHQAMRYGCLNGGKRLRPLLVYAAGESLGAALEQLDPIACAIEFIHGYSLIHDDLPALDNDDFRRGQASCHKAFGEATAILAGDALQALAFEILADNQRLSAEQRLKLILVLTQSIGVAGMAGGQALEFECDPKKSDLSQLENIHRLKTGKLIRASVQMGAIAAGASITQLTQLDNFANHLGLAFQIQDDIHDHALQSDKFSYLNYLDLNSAQAKVNELQQLACDNLQSFGDQALPLQWVMENLIQEQ